MAVIIKCRLGNSLQIMQQGFQNRPDYWFSKCSSYVNDLVWSGFAMSSVCRVTICTCVYGGQNNFFILWGRKRNTCTAFTVKSSLLILIIFHQTTDQLARNKLMHYYVWCGENWEKTLNLVFINDIVHVWALQLVWVLLKQIACCL